MRRHTHIRTPSKVYKPTGSKRRLLAKLRDKKPNRKVEQ